MRIAEPGPRDEAAIDELMRVCLGEPAGRKRDRATWAWKHEQSPFGRSIVRIATDGYDAIGLRAFMRWRFAHQDGAVDAVRAVDTATHPDHRRLGVFSTLTERAVEDARGLGVEMVFNTPNERSRPGYLKLGWQLVGRMPLEFSIRKPARFASGLLRHAFGAGSDGRPGTTTSASDARPARELLADAPALAALLAADRALRGPGLATPRSPEFLSWRYTAHPQVRYFVETEHDAEGLSAAIVWRPNRRYGLDEAIVCDLLLRNADAAAVRRLVDAVAARSSCDYLVAHFGLGSAHRSLIRDAGFHGLPGQGVVLVVRPLVERPGLDPVRAASWSLCLGDLELF